MIPLHYEDENPLLIEKLNLDLELAIEKGLIVPSDLDDYSAMVFAWANIDDETGSYQFVAAALKEPPLTSGYNFICVSFPFDPDTKKFKFGDNGSEFERFMRFAQEQILSNYRHRVIEDGELNTMSNEKLSKLLVESVPDINYLACLNTFVKRLHQSYDEDEQPSFKP